MRVLHVISDLGTYGAERFVTRLLEAFDEPGIESAVLTVAVPSAPRRPPPVQVFAADRRGRADVGFLSRMISAMRRWRPDVVHTHTHLGKYYGRLAALAAGVPRIVHTEHNSEFGAPGMFRAWDRLLGPRTAAFVTFSPVQRERLVREDRLPRARIVVIPNGIPIPPAAEAGARANARAALGARDEHERVLVHVGRLAPVKNQRLAIEALALLSEPARLVLVGEGGDRPALAALARERGLAARVTFLGYYDDAAALLPGADAVVVSSRNEAMPLTVVEAMVAGAPLVSTPWAGVADMLAAGRYGVVAADFTPAALAAALDARFAQPDAAAERAARAEVFARTEYDIRTTVRRHVELYRALSAGTRAARSRMTSARS